MKKGLLMALMLPLLFVNIAFADGIEFLENRTWNEILSKAKKENKLIFLDAYATWCGPCKYLQKNVFTDNEVGVFFNSKFINVKIDMEVGEGIELAERYNVTSYPTLFFINGDGKLVHKSIGAMDSEDFIELGKKAYNPETQYYPLLEKARKGSLSPAAFHSWVHDAEKMEEDNLDAIIDNYIAKSSYPLMEKEMLSILIDHGKLDGKKQMDLLFENRTKAASILNITADEFNKQLRNKIISFGRTKLFKDEINISQFRTLIDAYYPLHSKLETKKARVSYFKFKENNEKAVSEFSELLADASYGLGANGISSMVLEMILIIGEEQKESEFIDLIKAYKFTGEDIGKEYYRDFTLGLLYYSKGDGENMNYHVTRMAENEDTPEALIDFFLELLED